MGKPGIGKERPMEKGQGRNFERPHVERPIFRNLKIANVKNYEVQFFDFFIYGLFLLEHANFRFFSILTFNYWTISRI